MPEPTRAHWDLEALRAAVYADAQALMDRTQPAGEPAPNGSERKEHQTKAGRLVTLLKFEIRAGKLLQAS